MCQMGREGIRGSGRQGSAAGETQVLSCEGKGKTNSKDVYLPVKCQIWGKQQSIKIVTQGSITVGLTFFYEYKSRDG